MTRIQLVDDHALFRKGMRSLLESHEGIEVVAEASDARTAVEQYASIHPDVVLMDYGLPYEDGLSALRSILALDPEARVVMLSAFDFETQVVDCLRAGARGYLSKDLDPDDVFRGIESVASGGVALTASYLAALVTGDDTVSRPKEDDPLTSREREVASLVARGLTNREIAERLTLSPSTVKAHVANILAKLGLRGRTELTSWAFVHGIAETDV